MLGILRPRTLQLYVLREFAIAFSLALAACTLFMLLGIFFMKASDYQEFGITFGQVAMLAPYLMPKALALSVPPATMIAVATVFGRLSAENEILAAQAGGAPIRVLALPLLLCACFLSAFGLWCNQGGLRWGYSTIRTEVLKVDKVAFFESLDWPGNSITLKLESGGLARINWLPHDRDPKTGGARHPVHIAYFQNQEVARMVLAKHHIAKYDRGPTGQERILTLTLQEAQVLGERSRPTESREARPELGDLKSFCGEFTLEIKLPPPSQFITIGDSRGDRGWLENHEAVVAIARTFRQREAFMLQRAAEVGAHAVAGSPADPAAPSLCAESWNEARISSEAANGPTGAHDRAQAEEAEAFRKIGLGILSFSMVVLGIGLGLLVQKSQRLIGFLLGLVVYALLYYPLAIISKELARAGKLGVWSLFLPNLVLILLGYGLWRAFERGWLGGVSGRVSALGADAVHLLTVAAAALWRPVTALREYGARLLRRKTDGYIAGSFLGPLLVVVLAVGSLLTALDLVEHGTEVVDSVMKAREPLPGVDPRTEGQAVLHVVTYYGIRALEMVCDLLPLLILVAGVLCVTALVHNNEHLILKSCGLRLQRAFRPIICVALLFAVGVAVLRETAMPGLIMRRDYLRPLVYRHAPAPTALALPTLDDQGRQVVFQMSQYTSSRKEGRNLRVYQLTNEGRMPVITADRASWDGQAWQLETIPPPPAIGKGAGKDKRGDKEKPEPAPPRARLPHGYLVCSEVETPAGGAASDYGEIRPVHTTKTEVAEWRGAITPAFLESERLGPGVMNLAALESASKVKPELKVEWWRRVTEVVTGVFLLWLAIPMLVSEKRGPVWGVGLSIAFGAAYWGLNMACAEGARQAVLPVWSPLLVASLFLVLGVWRYHLSMET